jgi:hypothetical protein
MKMSSLLPNAYIAILPLIFQKACGKMIDSYSISSIEVVLLDIIVGKSEVYRHLLMNKFRQGHKVKRKKYNIGS